MKKLLTISLFAVLLSSCTAYQAVYDISMSEVERPLTAQERYGEYVISKNDSLQKFTYEDDMITSIFIVGDKQIAFEMTNKTDHTIKINWDEAAYIDVNGSTSKVIHSGIRYMDKAAPQAPSVIIKGAKLNDIIAPTDYIYYSEGWKSKNLLVNFGYDAEALKSASQTNVGKSIRVLIPIVIEDVQNDYLLTFNISNAEIKTTKGVVLTWE